MDNSRHIIITGFMGSGKTTVARALARILGCELLDLDQRIAEEEGRTAKEIIERDGEDSFRNVETERMRDALASGCACVIALGGGAWTLERNRDLINHHGAVTVWLDAPFKVCWDRILRSGGDRPLARDEEQASALFAERKPLYALANLRIPVAAGDSTDNISAKIARALADC
jgi:shikimate kinase